MLVLCPECRQHYDHRAQSEECDGYSGHAVIGMTAIAEHRVNVAGGATRATLVAARQRTPTGPETDAQP